ncbi:tyrosine-protein kinase receptor UFO-like [Physella acuta]|uniref:tyrosine-protein kinase receptor UFO-like n=1 Tax=Physella acuta TaxID=109671 RepID=UPI0027DCE791|nr:tyrosine-protein kinase receptor UFO-like [Physella acuta]
MSNMIPEIEKKADLDKIIIQFNRLAVGKLIGEGTKSDCENQELFVQEALNTLMMKDFQHPRVLGLVGLAQNGPDNLYVVLPYMSNGALLTFIRDQSVTLKFSDALKYGADIASGMAYLSVRDFVHRDLAARNYDRLRVKIGDFGLCRSVYGSSYYTSTNRTMLPIRWMAPESIEVGCYSTKSDVWSFGVVLWELLTRGLIPYPGLQNSEVHGYLQQSRLARPYFCPVRIYGVMTSCWQVDTGLRPNFQSLEEFYVKKRLDVVMTIPDCRFLCGSADEGTNSQASPSALDMDYIQAIDGYNYNSNVPNQDVSTTDTPDRVYSNVIDNYEEISVL